MTLARIYSDEPAGTFVRAPFGENKRPTKLYPLWSTPTKSFADFGVSVRMYFSTLLALAAFLAMAGFLNLPLSYYFWQDSYSSGTDDLAVPVRASAVCVDTEWVECDSCQGFMHEDRLWYQNNDNYDNNQQQQQQGDDDAAAQQQQYPYALKNECNFSDWLMPGILSFGASLLLIVQFGFAFFWLQPSAEVVFDEEVQTASDYSIKISNPPPDAVDPSEWKDYLAQFGSVAYVTVAIDNARLLQTLVSHKRTRMQLARKLPANCDTFDKEQVEKAIAELPKTCCSCSIPFLFPSPSALWSKLQKLQTQVEELARKPYRAVAVFATFDTERAQRNCLYTLTPSKLNLWRQTIDTSRFDETGCMIVNEKVESSRLPETLLDFADWKEEATGDFVVNLAHADTKAQLQDALGFRGRHVVAIKESMEPTDIRWMDLEVSSLVRFVQYIGTTAMVLWFMHWSAYFIRAIYTEDPGSYLIPLFIAVVRTF